MEHFITDEGDEARCRISDVTPRQVCKWHLTYKTLHNNSSRYACFFFTVHSFHMKMKVITVLVLANSMSIRTPGSGGRSFVYMGENEVALH